MRIRKRKVPLPLSLLSPVPLTDPHLLSRSPVMLVQELGLAPSLSPDHLTTTTTATCPETTSTSDLRRGVIVESTRAVEVMGSEDVVEGVVQTSNDDASNASLTTTSVAAIAPEYNDNCPLLLSLSSNEDQVGWWCDDDKAVPLKKRRGIEFNNCFVDHDDKEKDMITTTATTMIMMKWKIDDKDEEEEKQRGSSVVVVAADDDTSKKDSSAKKGNSKRGNTILEGSRCSRVNGRGWRCCQPTLVGYSLCEHHLGKGRLRSMASSGAKSRSSSAKRKSSTKSTSTTTEFALGRDDERETTMDNDDNEKKLERMSSFGNKRVKLGVVKARSLSSLLGQTNTVNNIVEDHANM